MSNFSNLVVKRQLDGTVAQRVANGNQGSQMVQAGQPVVCMDHLRDVKNQIRYGETNRQFKIPRGSLLSNTMLKVTLGASPAPTGNGNNLGLEKGWGFIVASLLSYKCGSSDRVQMTGRCNHLMVMDEIDDVEARDRILELAGKEVGNLATTAPPAVFDSITALVPLALPWSCFGQGHKNKTPYDSSALSSEVDIYVNCENYQNIFLNYTNYTGNGGVMPSVDMELVTMSFNFVDPMNQVGMYVGRSRGDQPSRKYNYNFQFPVEFTRDFAAKNSISDPAKVNISSLKSGNTVGITLACVPIQDPIGVYRRKLDYVKIKDLIVEIDGQRYLQSKDQENQLFDYARSNSEKQYDSTSSVSGAGGYLATNKATWFSLSTSQYDKHCSDSSGYLDSGMELSNRTLKLDFTIDVTNAEVTAGTQYRLYICQHLQAAIATENGVNKISFLDI
jgi:hypothetical protein